MNYPLTGKLFYWLFVLLMICFFGASSFVCSVQADDLKKYQEIFRGESGVFAGFKGDETDLDECLRIALLRNPSLRSAFFEWLSAHEKIRQSFSLPDPQVSFKQSDISNPDSDREYGLMQMIPLFDKLWIKRDMQASLSDSSYQMFKAKMRDVSFSLAEVYYEYAFIKQEIRLTRDNIELLKQLESVTRVKYTSGLMSNQDFLKVQVEREKLQNDLQGFQDMEEPVAARLRALLYLGDEDPIPAPAEKLEDIPSSGPEESFDIAARSMKDSNPEILQMRAEVEMNRRSLKMAKRDYVPDMTLEVSKMNSGDTMAGGGENPVMFKVLFSVPLWLGKVNSGISSAEAQLSAAENRLSSKEKELASELKMVLYRIRDSRRQAQLYKESLIPKALQTLNATKSAYETGGADFLSVIDAQRMLLDFQMNYYRQNSRCRTALAELEKISLNDRKLDEGIQE